MIFRGLLNKESGDPRVTIAVGITFDLGTLVPRSGFFQGVQCSAAGTACPKLEHSEHSCQQVLVKGMRDKGYPDGKDSVSQI
jgi:hypothetical protein